MILKKKVILLLEKGLMITANSCCLSGLITIQNVHRMHNAATGLQSKGTTQSYAEAIHAGHLKQSSITNGNECRWTVIFIMINFINGKTESQLSQFKADKRLRQCRSFVLWLTYAGGKIRS
jgi:hypothetical protein